MVSIFSTRVNAAFHPPPFSPPPKATQLATRGVNQKCLQEKIQRLSFFLSANITFTLCHVLLEKKLTSTFDQLITSSSDTTHFIKQLRAALNFKESQSSYLYFAVCRLLTSASSLHLVMRIVSGLLEPALSIFIGKTRHALHNFSKEQYINSIENILQEVSNLMEQISAKKQTPDTLARDLKKRYPQKSFNFLIDKIIRLVSSQLKVDFWANWRLSCSFAIIRFILPYLQPLMTQLIEQKAAQLEQNPKIRTKVFHLLTDFVGNLNLKTSNAPKKSPPKYSSDCQKIADQVSTFIDQFAYPLIQSETAKVTSAMWKPVRKNFHSYTLDYMVTKVSQTFEKVKFNEVASFIAKNTGMQRVATDIAEGIQGAIKSAILEQIEIQKKKLIPTVIAQLDQLLTQATKPETIDNALILGIDRTIHALQAPPSQVRRHLRQEKVCFIQTCYSQLNTLLTNRVNSHLQTSFKKNRMRSFAATVEQYLNSAAQLPKKLCRTIQEFQYKDWEIDQADLGFIEETYEKTKNVLKAATKVTYFIGKTSFHYLGGSFLLAAGKTWSTEFFRGIKKTASIGKARCQKVTKPLTKKLKSQIKRPTKASMHQKMAKTFSTYIVDRIDQSLDWALHPELTKQIGTHALSLLADALETLDAPSAQQQKAVAQIIRKV